MLMLRGVILIKIIIEHKSYLNELLNYIINDFIRFRKEHDDNTVGAMIVCKTNNQAREMYKLWQERYEKCLNLKEKKETELTEKDIMSNYQGEFIPLKASLILHDEGDKLERKEYIDEGKNKRNTVRGASCIVYSIHFIGK